MNATQKDVMQNGQGLIAALDQSGGSTPKTLSIYGVEPSDYNGDDEMFAAMHDMRARIILADSFTAEKVIAAILFERTMDGQINGKPVPQLLWEDRGVVPFLKIDKGLEEPSQGVQLLKSMPGLDELLGRARDAGIFGTKARSVVHEADAAGIEAIIAQQIEVGKTVCASGLVPILEPEVNISSETKAQAEDLLASTLLRHLDGLSADELVMIKLTIPEKPGLYNAVADHPNVLRVVALSGGYSTDEAAARLKKNTKMIASFSRALTEGLKVSMSDDAFNATLAGNIDKIFEASIA
ncbi:MAG: fructose bisphosphate aldolase [Sulfitobacter sp.]